VNCNYVFMRGCRNIKYILTHVYLLFIIIHRQLSMKENTNKVIQMIEKYRGFTDLFKALSDTNRLMIVDMLSCGELCACMILKNFNITQPTLSHHMKILCDCGLVNGRKDSKWMYYSLNEKVIQDFQTFVIEITSEKPCCIFIETPYCEESC